MKAISCKIIKVSKTWFLKQNSEKLIYLVGRKKAFFNFLQIFDGGTKNNILGRESNAFKNMTDATFLGNILEDT